MQETLELSEPCYPAVNSYTEWDRLEEVVVGRLDGGVVPTWQNSMESTMPADVWKMFKARGGDVFPIGQLDAAQDELDNLVSVLGEQGVLVRRPEEVAHHQKFATPNWESSGGLYAGMPRDCLMVIGDAIIEAPMSWRCRYHETDAFRSLIKAYFRGGSRWIPAPKPTLMPELYADAETDASQEWAVTEFEPVFDAADFMRFGTDVVAQLSHVTNQFGIDWLQRAIGEAFRVRVLKVDDPHAMHIDATIAPLAPGTLLVNPDRFLNDSMFQGWDILAAPPPALPDEWPMYFCSPWVSMNVLSLDPETVVVESHEQPLIDVLRKAGFNTIPVPFRHVYTFGGSFHCVTLDVRRDGGPVSVLHGDGVGPTLTAGEC